MKYIYNKDRTEKMTELQRLFGYLFKYDIEDGSFKSQKTIIDSNRLKDKKINCSRLSSIEIERNSTTSSIEILNEGVKGVKFT